MSVLASGTTPGVADVMPTPIVPPRVVNGNTLNLRAVPESVSRVAFPLVPHEWNRLDLEYPRIQRVLEVPEGFEVALTTTGLLVRTDDADAWGYVTLETASQPLRVTLLATTPFGEMVDGRIEGYSIGNYRQEPLNGLPSYERPTGFVRLTKEKEDVWISDHYRLRDMQCKQEGDPRFLVVRPEALIKLELLQDRFTAETGFRFDRFTIMSAYRTPHYNARIGNETTYSRHLYGDGLDVYIDRDGDSKMDDLNGDGRIDERDAVMLMETAARIDASPEWEWIKGGAGVYRRNHAHGPYLHIDTRGFVARWGVPN